MSDKITSMTKQIAKNLNNVKDDYKFIEIVQHFTTPKQIGKIDTGYLYSFEKYLDVLYMMTKKSGIQLDELGFRLSSASASELGIFEYPKPWNKRERIYILPEHSKGIADENDCLENVSLIEINRLYPTLINNGLQNRTLSPTFHGFDELFDELLTNYAYFKQNVDKSAFVMVRVVLNITYGFMVSKKRYFEFTKDSICPLRQFRIDMNEAIDEDKILHYSTDDIMVKSHYIGSVLEDLKPVFEKHGLLYEIEHHKYFKIDSKWRRYLYKHYTGKKLQRPN